MARSHAGAGHERRGARFGFAATLALALASAAAAQIPDTFTNLKVFPREVTKVELVQAMRGFASALGVRCVHCHATKAGADPTSDDLADIDFASDAREAKVRAREMITMVRAINTDYLAKLTGGAMIQVRCATCHRGLTEPELMDDRMARLLEEEGVEAAVDDYRELRAEYHGSGSYDFGQKPLNALGERLIRAGKSADAEALLALNAEYHPDADWTLTLLGEAQLKNGKRDAARATFEKVLELDPESELAKKRLAELAPEPPAPEPPPPPPPGR
jgi:tetratricopeptide (TPR) repeat protein